MTLWVVQALHVPVTRLNLVGFFSALVEHFSLRSGRHQASTCEAAVGDLWSRHVVDHHSPAWGLLMTVSPVAAHAISGQTHANNFLPSGLRALVALWYCVNAVGEWSAKGQGGVPSCSGLHGGMVWVVCVTFPICDATCFMFCTALS